MIKIRMHSPVKNRPQTQISRGLTILSEMISNQFQQKISCYSSKKSSEYSKIERKNCSQQIKNLESPFQLSYRQYIDNSFQQPLGNQYLVIATKRRSQEKPIWIVKPQNVSNWSLQKRNCSLLTQGVQMGIRREKQEGKPIRYESLAPRKPKMQPRSSTTSSYNQQIFYPGKNSGTFQRKIKTDRKMHSKAFWNFRTPRHKLKEEILIFYDKLDSPDDLPSNKNVEVLKEISRGKISGYEYKSSESKCELEEYMNARNSDFY